MANQIIKCKCGSIYKKSGKARHLKTKKHMNYKPKLKDIFYDRIPLDLERMIYEFSQDRAPYDLCIKKLNDMYEQGECGCSEVPFERYDKVNVDGVICWNCLRAYSKTSNYLYDPFNKPIVEAAALIMKLNLDLNYTAFIDKGHVFLYDDQNRCTFINIARVQRICQWRAKRYKRYKNPHKAGKRLVQLSRYIPMKK
jgi:hypothetical protein